MKEKVFKNKDMMFCPSCHKKVENPMKGANITGTLRIACGCKKGVCIVKK